MKATRTATVLLWQAIELLEEEATFADVQDRKDFLNEMARLVSEAVGQLIEHDGAPQ